VGGVMLVRLALEEDVEDIVRMAELNSVISKVMFNPERVRDTFRDYLDTANPTFFVCEGEGRKLAGFLEATINDYDYRDGIFVCQKVLFVSPENRGTRAAVYLTKHLIAWARLLDAVEIVGGNDNGYQSERTAKFLEHFGFRKVGYAMAMAL
jgi:GNAT superfamily N-acetyltransferase